LAGFEDQPFGLRGSARMAGLEAIALSEALLKRSVSGVPSRSPQMADPRNKPKA